MKPIQTVVRETQNKNSKGNPSPKKYISAPQKELPEVGSQVIICEPTLLKGFEILNTAFLALIKTKNPSILNEIKKHISANEAKFLKEVSKDVGMG